MHSAVERIAGVKFAGDLSVSRSVHEKRAGYPGCGKDQREIIRQAAQVAQDMLTVTYNHVYGLRDSTALSGIWFGAYTEGRMWKVRDTLWWAKETGFSGITFNCTCERIEVEKLVEAYIGMCLFQIWDRRSVTDISLDQTGGSPEPYGSALRSGSTAIILDKPGY